jgi:hypothetical protein
MMGSNKPLYTYHKSTCDDGPRAVGPGPVGTLCLGETPSPRVRCQLALFTYYLTYAGRNSEPGPQSSQSSEAQLHVSAQMGG